MDLPGRDGIRDFLADDLGVLSVYESQSLQSSVSDLSTGASLALTGTSGTSATYSFAMASGGSLSYAKLSDPLGGQKVVKSVTRSDGKIMVKDNVWLSKRRNEVTKAWEHFFHLFDSDTTGSYTVVFDDPPVGPRPPVLQFIPDLIAVEGSQASFIVTASDPDGTTPVISAAPLPAGASFVGQSAGVALFDWYPAVGQAGTYDITYAASDGTLSDTQRARITVRPVWDTDGDGITDAWELAHFGSLARDGSGDADGDGQTDREEFLAGTDPNTGLAPSIPVVLAPADGAEVAAFQPELIVRDSVDRDGGTITYAFEVYADAGLTQLVASAAGVAPGARSTSWTVPAPLADNTLYAWRARATDGAHLSAWAYGRFFVNTANDSPEGVALSSPRNGMAVDSLTPVLEAANARDVDGDALTYAFEVFGDAGLTVPVANAAGIYAGANGVTSWTLSTPLTDGLPYWWRATATDAHGGATAAASSFTVNTANHAPTFAAIDAPVSGSVVTEVAVTLTAANAADADSDPLMYLFEVDTTNSFNSGNLIRSAAIAEGAGTTSWAVSEALADNTLHYWRVRASDGSADGPWTTGSFLVNTANDAPATPTVRNPSDGGEVWTVSPELVLNPATDPDGDALTYDYEVYRDVALTTLVTSAAGQALVWTVPVTLTSDSSYHWRARAADIHGAVSAWTAATSFFINLEGYNNPPTIALSRPAAAEPVTNATSFEIAWTDGDPDGNASISLFYDTDGADFDGMPITAGIEENDTANAYTWDTSSFPDGTYYVYAVIADEENEARAYAPGPLVIDRTAPVILIADVPSGCVPTAVTPWIEVTDPHLDAGKTTITLNGAPFLNGTPISAGGEYLLSAVAVDLVGNVSSVTAAFTIDTVPPVVAIQGVQDGARYNTDVVPAVTLTDAHLVRTTVLLDDQVFVSGTPVSTEGAHLLTAGAEDCAGQVTSAAVSFTIDKTPPAAPVLAQAVSPTNYQITTVQATYDGSDTQQLELFHGGVSLGTVTGDATGAISWASVAIAVGDNLFEVEARDEVGNVSRSAPMLVDGDRTAPAWVSTVGAQFASPGNGAAWVYWNDAVDRNGTVHWNIYYGTSLPLDFATAAKVADVHPESGGVFTWAYRVDGLDNHTTYYFAVRAEDTVTNPNEDANTVTEWVTPHPGASFRHHAWGSASNGLSVTDLDGDGSKEALLATDQGLMIWARDAQGDWADETSAWGAFPAERCLALLAADLDNDGDQDVVLAGETLRLYRNDGAGHLMESTAGSGLANPPGALSVGVNGISVGSDGFLDLLVSFEANGEGRFFSVYRNLGDTDGDGAADLAFADGAAQTGLSRTSLIRSVVAGDLNGDGAADLLLAGGNENTLFLNDGAGRFSDMTSTNVPAINSDIRGTVRADMDSDGDLDLFLANRGERSYLFLNDGAGRFVNASSGLRGLVGSETGTSAAEGDFDHDGDRDLFLSLGSLNLLFENQGDGTFVEVSSEAGIRAGGGETAVSADLDGDGDLDVVTSGGDRYENLRNDAAWLQVRLVGTLTNADAVGSRVRVYRAGHLGDPAALEGFAEVAAGMGYRSQSPRDLHFGLDPAGLYDVRAVFGSGITVEARGVPTGRLIVLVEDNTPPVTADDYTFDGIWKREDALIRLSATDDISGVGQTLYRLDGQESAYVSPIAITAEGAHLLEYWSVDVAKNAETPHAIQVRIDKTAPVTGHDFFADGLWVNSGLTVNLLSDDSQPGIMSSGVAHVYSIVNGALPAEDLLALPFTADGIYSIQFRSLDVAGNEEIPKGLTVKIDTTAPTTVIAVGVPKSQGAELYVTPATVFTLSATDAGSGVSATEYRVDGGMWTVYAPFSLTGEGTHQIEYRSRDRVENLEAAGSLNVVLDNTPPATAIAVATQSMKGRRSSSRELLRSRSWPPTPRAAWRFPSSASRRQVCG
ncbi:MAG: OmpL47-type beta-barrel domain-containing protein [Candidatus Methylomirabilia bacterium]